MRIVLFFTALITLFKLALVFPINNLSNATYHHEIEHTVKRRACSNYKHFVGSNLFDGSRKICFSVNDVNVLVARRSFELMVPKDLPDDLLDDKSVSLILRYFYYGLWLLRRMDDCKLRHIMEKAFYDTLGGFLRYYLVPMCKFSFYSSKVELKTVRNVIMLYEKCRAFLNTNGNGWRAPMRNPLTELKAVRIKPLMFNDEDQCDAGGRFCTDLDLDGGGGNMEVVEESMLVPLPKIECEDSDGFLSNIWIPFSRKRTYNLRSCKSAFIIVKFYISVSRCYRKKALNQKVFDNKFRQWIVENIKMHLADEQLYPGLGGILNVYEYLRKGSRNAPTTENKDDEKDEKDDDVAGIAESAIGFRELLQKIDDTAERNSMDGTDALQQPDEYDDISTLNKRDVQDATKQNQHQHQQQQQQQQQQHQGTSDDTQVEKNNEEEAAETWGEKYDVNPADATPRKKIKKMKTRPKCKKKKPKNETAIALKQKNKKCKKPAATRMKQMLRWIIYAVALILLIILLIVMFMFCKSRRGANFRERVKNSFRRMFPGKGGKGMPLLVVDQSDGTSKGSKKGKKGKDSAKSKEEKKAAKAAAKKAKEEAKKAAKAAKAAKKAAKKKGAAVKTAASDPKLDKKAAKAAQKAAAKAAKAAAKAEKEKAKREKKEQAKLKKQLKGKKGSLANTSASETSTSLRRRGGGLPKSVAFRKRSRQRRYGRTSRSRSRSRSVTRSNISSI